MASIPSTARPLVALVLVGSALLFAGCEAEFSTGEDQIDEASAELTIKRQYTEQYPGLELVSLDCGTTDIKSGSTFTCKGSNDNGVDLDFEGTVKGVDEETDKVNFSWTITRAVTDGSAYEEPAIKALRKIGAPVTSMACPSFTIEKGEKIRCDVTMQDGSMTTAVLTLTDSNGAFEVSLDRNS